MPKRHVPGSPRGEEGSQHRFRFAERWERKRSRRQPRALWITMALDVLLILLIIAMIYVAFRAW